VKDGIGPSCKSSNRRLKYPWVRFRIVDRCVLIQVPRGWTGECFVVEAEGISKHRHSGTQPSCQEA
jgi:hypothetical protein